MTVTTDLGHGHTLSYFVWSPDRELNPRWADEPDIDPAGAIIEHPAPDGSECKSAVHFDVPGIRRIAPNQPVWQVESWEPLTLSPSLLCRRCGDHGFIRDGRWVVS